MPKGPEKSILQQGQERIAWSLLRISAVGVCIVLPIMYLTPGNDDVLTTIFYTPIIGSLIGIRWLLKRGHVHAAGFWLTALNFGISTGAIAILGGVHVAVTGSYFVSVMVAAATAGPRAAAAWTLAACVALGGFGAIEYFGYLPEPQADATSIINAIASSVFPLLMSVALLRLMLRVRDDAIEAAEERERERDQAEAEMLQAQKMDVVGRLASGVAHDFNNLLTVIQATVDVIRIAGPDDELLEDVDNATKRASMLTRRLLTFARPRTPDTEVLDLATAIADIQPLLDTMAGDEIHLTCDTVAGANIVIDELAFQQIVLNLVINGREAQDGRGRIALRVDEEEDGVALTVSDAGPGIPESIRAKVFDPFFTTKASGTGLGLSTIKRLVDDSDGTVTVRNLEPGAEFRIVWPPAGRESSARANENAGFRTLQFSPTILVVDDNDAVRRSMAALLRAQGWTVDEATDGLEALAHLERTDADLIVSDCAMPGITGPEFAERLRDLDNQTPVILVSGQGLEAELPASCVFLPKPFGADKLLHTIGEALVEFDGPHQTAS